MKKNILHHCFTVTAALFMVFSFAACNQKTATDNNSSTALQVQSEQQEMLSSEQNRSTVLGNESTQNGSVASGSATYSNQTGSTGSTQGGKDVEIDVGDLNFKTSSTGSASASSQKPAAQTSSKAESQTSSKPSTSSNASSTSSSANDGWTHDYIIKK